MSVAYYPNLAAFAGSLDRVTRYLASSKLNFTPEGTLELNPAPFVNAAKAAGPCTPLAYAALLLKETCWEEADLQARQILVEALSLWCHHQLYLQGLAHGA